jgi:protein-S-isoprenylcysteine O-methyltransferase Ste14
VRQRHFIDSHKAATGLFVLALMAWYGRWDNPTAWVYLALHGTYGLLWVFKSRVFPDRQWEQAASVVYGLGIWAFLTLYWIAAWLIVAQDVRAPGWYTALCVSLYAFGVFLHFASDMQKHTTLALQPGLITTGLWARVRNPNYLGELLIYLGFGLLAMHWLPLLVIAIALAAVWVPNMRKKDRSLARYPEFEAYRAATKLLIPFVW